VRHQGDSNLALSDRRAKSVAAVLGSYTKNIDAYGIGATEPKVTCSDIKEMKMLEECLMPNRRVDIKVELLAAPS